LASNPLYPFASRGIDVRRTEVRLLLLRVRVIEQLLS